MLNPNQLLINLEKRTSQRKIKLDDYGGLYINIILIAKLGSDFFPTTLKNVLNYATPT
jgi:hypothetical protein